MLSIRKKKGEKEVPQWKLDMLGERKAPAPAPAPTPAPAAASSSAGVAPRSVNYPARAPHRLLAFAGEASGQKRSLGEEEPAAQSGAHRSHDESDGREVRHRPRDDDDDDDDDDDVDLSAYELGDEEKPREEVAHASAQPSSMSREEMLLMREAQEGGPKSRKTFFVDDSAGSIEKSAGKERRDDLKKTRILAKQVMGGSNQPPGSGSDRMGRR
jgi:hypothetical protein